VKHHRNSEPRVFLHPLLNGIGQLRHFPRASVAARVFARPRYLSEPVLESDPSPLGQKQALVIHEERLHFPHERAVLPGAVNLRQFLLERHSRQQIRYPLLQGELGILVRRYVVGRPRSRHRAREQGRQERKNRLPQSRVLLHAGLLSFLIPCIRPSAWYYTRPFPLTVKICAFCDCAARLRYFIFS